MQKPRTNRGPGRPPRSENRDTRANIIRSAEALFAQTGFEATSLRQIAIHADVDLATVKYHFSEKSELYDEAYRLGHQRLIEHFSPLMVSIAAATDEATLRKAIQAFASAIPRFIDEQHAFVRLGLFRNLEGADDHTSLTARLQAELVELLVIGFGRARAAAIGRDIDVRAFITFITVAVPMWLASTTYQREMLGEPCKGDDGWEARVDSFLVDLMLRYMLPSIA